MDNKNLKLIKAKEVTKKTLLYAVLIFFSIITLLPLFWMTVTSLKTQGHALEMKFIPDKGELWSTYYTFMNFKNVLFNPDYPFYRFFLNSAIVATSAGIITSVMCLFAAYAFARKNFPGKNVLFIFLMSALMIPGMIFMVPQFAIVKNIGWFNTWAGLVIPHTANVLGILLIRQAIEKIPNSLFEAVQVDGANDFQVLKIVVMPLVMPVIVTLFLLTFLFQWSNFLWQLIITKAGSIEWTTLPVGLARFQGQYDFEWEKMMAASCISLVPIIIIFLFLQRFIMSGLTQGGVKE